MSDSIRLRSATAARSRADAVRADTTVATIAARLDRLPLTSYQRGIFLIIATAWFFDSVDLGALTFVLGSIRQEFALTPAAAGLLSSMSFIGMFVGASLAGMLADRFGRNVVFQTSMIFWGLGSVACGFTTDVTQLALARVLVGFGMGMEFPVAQAIVSEMMPPANRGRYIAFLEGFWPIGFIASGLLALFVLPVGGWRWVFILEGIPAAFVLIIRYRVPESPRWLATHGHVDRAERVMAGIERQVQRRHGGPLPTPVPQAVQFGDRRGLGALWADGYARRTVMLWGLWFFALLGYYGLTTWLGALLQQKGFPVTKSVYYTILISLAGIPGFIASAWLVEAWGRKPTCITMLLGSALASYFYGTATSEAQLIGFGLCMQFCLFGMWSVLYAYTPELYPTRIRATGSGCASAVGRLGSLIGPYAVGTLLPLGGQSAVFSMGAGAFVLAALFIFTLGEETRGRSLEEISR